MSISNIIITLLATLLGGGSIASIFFYRESKKLKQAEADMTFAEGWKTLADERIKESQDLKSRLDECMSENLRLRIEKQEILVTMIGLCYERCQVSTCKNRQPDDNTNKHAAKLYSDKYVNKVKEFASSDI